MYFSAFGSLRGVQVHARGDTDCDPQPKSLFFREPKNGRDCCSVRVDLLGSVTNRFYLATIVSNRLYRLVRPLAELIARGANRKDVTGNWVPSHNGQVRCMTLNEAFTLSN